MKTSVLKTALIIGLLAVPFALRAEAGRPAGVKSCPCSAAATASVPVPKTGAGLLPVVAAVEFTDGVTGKPVDLNPVGAMPNASAIPFERVVAQWRFAPVRTSTGRELTVGVTGTPVDNSRPLTTPKAVVAK